MTIRKDLVIAVLATFCLTAVLFTAMPVSSSGKQYDPWLDYNDDGIIDLKDVYPLHQAYGTSGDSTKNVNVTNWPQDRWESRLVYNESLGWITPDSGFVYIATIDLAGYRTLQIHTKIEGTWPDCAYIYIWYCWVSCGMILRDNSFQIELGPKTYPWYGTGSSGTINIRSDKLSLYLVVNNSPSANITLLTIATFLQN